MTNNFEIYNQVVGSLWEKFIGPTDSWFAMEVLNESLSTSNCTEFHDMLIVKAIIRMNQSPFVTSWYRLVVQIGRPSSKY